MIHLPVRPALDFSRTTSKVGLPCHWRAVPFSLPGGRLCESAGRTSQRLDAALASSPPPWRSRITGVLDAAARNAMRREKVKSASAGFPCNSSRHKPAFGVAAISPAAQSASCVFAACTLANCRGSRPNSAMPPAKKAAHSRRILALLTQKNLPCPPASIEPRPSAKPEAAAPSSVTAERTSCKAPGSSPERPSTASTASIANVLHGLSVSGPAASADGMRSSIRAISCESRARTLVRAKSFPAMESPFHVLFPLVAG